MADRTIGELPVADHLDDDSLLVVEQQAQARSIKGALVRQFAEAATDAHVKAAKAAAEMIGLGGGRPRAPLTELEPAHKEEMKKVLSDFGLHVIA